MNTMIEKDVGTLRAAEMAVSEDDAYILLRDLHSDDSGGLFTRVIAGKDIALGLSAATNSPMWNAALIRDVSQSRVDQAENIFFDQNRLPSFYMIEGDRSEEIFRYLTGRGYSHTWTDVWMGLTDSQELQEIIKTEPADIHITSANTDREIEAFLAVLMLRGYDMELGPEDPYGEITEEELAGYSKAVKDLVSTGRAKCTVVWNETSSDPEPVAAAMVAFLGTVAYISNLVTIPSERHRGYGRAALLGAIKAGYAETSRIAALEESDPIVCLATEPGQKPHAIFRQIGFRDMFTARGYTFSARNLFLSLKSY